MFVVLTGYACFTKTDMTNKGGLLCGIANSLFFLVIFMIFAGPGNNTLHMIIALLVVMCLSVFVVYDTQMIVGGTHKKF